MAKAVRKIVVTGFVCFVFVSLAVSQTVSSRATASRSSEGMAAKSPARTAQPMADVVRTLFAATTFDQAAISPDGRQVAWVERQGRIAIYVSEIGAPKPRRITAGGQSESASGMVA